MYVLVFSAILISKFVRKGCSKKFVRKGNIEILCKCLTKSMRFLNMRKNDKVIYNKRVVIYVQLFGTTSMTTLIFSHLIGQK